MESVAPNFQMFATFGVIVAAIILYATERLRIEVTSLLVLMALLFLFQVYPLPENNISPRDILSGFADPALITILALLVVGQGLVQTGALDDLSELLVNSGKRRPFLITVLTLIFVALMSGLMNNTPVVVIFIPILSVLALRTGRSSSTVMMPLSFAAILGGNLTLIGSSTNLLVSGEMERLTGAELNFFDITIPGLVLAGVGFLYLIFIAPRLLRKRTDMIGQMTGPDGKQFIVQVAVSRDSSLNGLTAQSGIFPGLQELTVRMVQRGENALLPPYDNVTLQPGDIMVLAATRATLVELLKKSPEMFHGFVDDHSDTDVDPEEILTGQQMLAEVVVSPTSVMDGRTLSQIGFHHQTNCVVLGIQRRSRMYRTSLNEIRLEAGDVLLVIGKRSDVMGLRANRDVLLLEWSASDVPLHAKSPIALAIFGGIVASAATGLLPIVIAALAGAGFMILAGCLNIRQATRAIDRQVVMIVGASLAMGTAMFATGGAEYIAINLINALHGAPETVILSAFFALVAIMTNILSNNATAVLFTPIALSISESLGVNPMIFVSAVIYAANASFATPMGYQTNLLVMGPGHYKFSDYIRTGAPLVVVLWATYTVFAPLYYGLN